VIVLDSSVLIAAALARDASHERAAQALSSHSREELVVPIAILAEAMAFLGRRVGVHGQRVFWDGFMESSIEILPVDAELVASARAIDADYDDVGFGFADCVLLASCERHECSKVLSLDSRLSAYRPTFGAELQLIP
jgi:predicted nucleic acid-binding protein